MPLGSGTALRPTGYVSQIRGTAARTLLETPGTGGPRPPSFRFVRHTQHQANPDTLVRRKVSAPWHLGLEEGNKRERTKCRRHQCGLICCLDGCSKFCFTERADAFQEMSWEEFSGCDVQCHVGAIKQSQNSSPSMGSLDAHLGVHIHCSPIQSISSPSLCRLSDH